MSKGKKMPEDELRKEVRKFLDERKELVLCTCSNNIPRATPIDFYTEKEGFNIYVGLAPGRKVKNIEENPVVSIGIYVPMDTGKIQGLQVTATGRERLVFLREGDEGYGEAQKLFREEET